MGERNDSIEKTIDNERMPLLPFEMELARRALQVHVEKQTELGRAMGEMMQQSSETWHDNAPAEAIMNDSKILASSAEKTIQILQNGEVFGYENDDSTVTLGSIVSVKYGNDDEIVKMLITGASRELPDDHMIDEYVDEDTEFQCVTLSSPVGKALFNKTVGETTSFGVNGRIVGLTIVDVQQFSVEAE